MIKPGQKLKEGDSVKVNVSESNELWKMVHGYELNIFNVTSIYYKSGFVSYSTHPNFKLESEYTFPDFKQLCENTFGSSDDKIINEQAEILSKSTGLDFDETKQIIKQTINSYES